jgi:AmmeMemoRadiSam system protein B
VQLPFLQEALGSFQLLPLVAGDATPQEVAEVLERVWGGPETLIVISSDLSHYHDHAVARTLDGVTTAAIEALRPEGLDEDSACGRVPVRVARRCARARTHGSHPRPAQPGDTAGPGSQSVTVPMSSPDGQLDRDRRITLLSVARASIEHSLCTGQPLGVDVRVAIARAAPPS